MLGYERVFVSLHATCDYSGWRSAEPAREFEDLEPLRNGVSYLESYFSTMPCAVVESKIDPTKVEIEDSVNAIRRSIRETAGNPDSRIAVVFYLGGHGDQDDDVGQYYARHVNGALAASQVSLAALKADLFLKLDVAHHILLILDSCRDLNSDLIPMGSRKRQPSPIIEANDRALLAECTAAAQLPGKQILCSSAPGNDHSWTIGAAC